MSLEYHIVYQVEPEIGRRELLRICETAADSRAGFYAELNYLLNRNETVLGVYITGTPWGDKNDITSLRAFKEYLARRL